MEGAGRAWALESMLGGAWGLAECEWVSIPKLCPCCRSCLVGVVPCAARFEKFCCVGLGVKGKKGDGMCAMQANNWQRFWGGHCVFPLHLRGAWLWYPSGLLFPVWFRLRHGMVQVPGGDSKGLAGWLAGGLARGLGGAFGLV